MGVYNYLSNLWVSLFLYFESYYDLISLNEWTDAVFQLTGVGADDLIEDQSCVPLQAPSPPIPLRWTKTKKSNSRTKVEPAKPKQTNELL